MITSLREHLTKRGFPAWFILSNSWNILQLKYRTTGFACFSRRVNAVSEKPRWTWCFLKCFTDCYKSAWSNSVFLWSTTLCNHCSPTVLLVRCFLEECQAFLKPVTTKTLIGVTHPLEILLTSNAESLHSGFNSDISLCLFYKQWTLVFKNLQ